MNTFGNRFRISIFGESHGPFVGVTIDGCPAGIRFTPDDLMADILRRKSGAKGITPRIEKDLPQIISGVFQNKTTGTPITIMFENCNTVSKDYSNLIKHPRPGHSDFVALKKYKGHNDYRGGGYFSGRLTLGLVAAGSIAKMLLPQISISAQLIEAGGQTNIEEAINQAVENNNSIGGIIECRAKGLPIGLEEPFFWLTSRFVEPSCVFDTRHKGHRIWCWFCCRKHDRKRTQRQHIRCKWNNRNKPCGRHKWRNI